MESLCASVPGLLFVSLGIPGFRLENPSKFAFERAPRYIALSKRESLEVINLWRFSRRQMLV